METTKLSKQNIFILFLSVHFVLGTVTVWRNIAMNKTDMYYGKFRERAEKKECWTGGSKFKCGISDGYIKTWKK